MKKRIFSVLLASVMAVATMAGCTTSDEINSSSAGGSSAAVTTPPMSSTAPTTTSSTATTDEMYKVVLITMDSTDQHWVSVDAGAQRAAEELGNIEYKWMAPDKKDDAQQIERINNAVADGADVIMIAANGPDAVTAALEEAKSKGVKIIYVDSPANTPAEATFSTDNFEAGRLAGEEMIKALNAKGITSGKIGVVNINTSTDSTVKREQGFREAFVGTEFEILETQYGEGDAAKSKDIADNFITQGVVGIFGANEGATVGVGNAIKGSGNADIVGVGFDKSNAILSLVEEGALHCVMAQNPEEMGYQGMIAAEQALSGETIPQTEVDTGVSIINKDNLPQ